MKTNHSLSIGTLSGTLLSVLPHLTSSDIIRTAILAAVGAAASFMVSFILRYIVNKIHHNLKQ